MTESGGELGIAEMSEGSAIGLIIPVPSDGDGDASELQAREELGFSKFAPGCCGPAPGVCDDIAPSVRDAAPSITTSVSGTNSSEPKSRLPGAFCCPLTSEPEAAGIGEMPNPPNGDAIPSSPVSDAFAVDEEAP